MYRVKLRQPTPFDDLPAKTPGDLPVLAAKRSKFQDILLYSSHDLGNLLGRSIVTISELLELEIVINITRYNKVNLRRLSVVILFERVISSYGNLKNLRVRSIQGNFGIAGKNKSFLVSFIARSSIFWNGISSHLVYFFRTVRYFSGRYEVRIIRIRVLELPHQNK